jgi:hypothetical protein
MDRIGNCWKKGKGKKWMLTNPLSQSPQTTSPISGTTTTTSTTSGLAMGGRMIALAIAFFAWRLLETEWGIVVISTTRLQAAEEEEE